MSRPRIKRLPPTTAPRIAKKGESNPKPADVALNPSQAPTRALPSASANPVVLVRADQAGCTHAEQRASPTGTPTEKEVTSSSVADTVGNAVSTISTPRNRPPNPNTVAYRERRAALPFRPKAPRRCTRSGSQSSDSTVSAANPSIEPSVIFAIEPRDIAGVKSMGRGR